MNEHHTHRHDHSFNDRRAMLAGIGGLAAGALLTGSAKAGPLDPPPGPIVPTGKPLNELEPRIAINSTNTPGDATSVFRITQPGSYHLTGNVTGAVGKDGIAIAASGVTLDLSGYALVGVPGSRFGIFAVESGLTDITIHHGMVTQWGNDGINLNNFSALNCIIHRVYASRNTGDGIYSGRDSIVHLCGASDNGESGIRADGSNTISHCSVGNNALRGIFTLNGCTIANCTATNNGDEGISSGGGLIDACVARSNTGNGIGTSGGVITNCHAEDNGNFGISGGVYSSISGSNGYRNDAGGIICSQSIVSGCTASFNNSAGIFVQSRSHVHNNICANNASIGIHIDGSDNRIEGNHCADSPIGILVDSSSNVIFRNTCADNSVVNWSISPNNYYGPIINRSGINTAAVNGNFAPSTLSSTDPHANFTY